MPPPFAITANRGKRLLVIRLTGFWSAVEMRAFATACRAEVAALPCRPGEHRILCDVAAWRIQSQETASAFGTWLAGASHAAQTRLAIVGASPLVRLQVARVAGGPTLRMFDRTKEATRWLLDDASADDQR